MHDDEWGQGSYKALLLKGPGKFHNNWFQAPADVMQAGQAPRSSQSFGSSASQEQHLARKVISTDWDPNGSGSNQKHQNGSLVNS